MRKRLAGVLLATALSGGGCHLHGGSFVKVDDVALGRVVVYRNGVAFYERRATVEGGTLTVSVPRDRVDDFLKSLTVTDANTKQPLPVSIPRQQNDDGPYLTMKLQLPSKAPADVVLTYVSESPAWKPSYRVVVADDGKRVMLEGWAIVDNTSGEDWKGVVVGVGSSSALSFRYDLWSVRQVQRETLANEERFAIAPPTGVSPYGGPPAGNVEPVIAELSDEEIRRPQGHPEDKSASRVAMKDAPPPPAPATPPQEVTTTGELDVYGADESSGAHAGPSLSDAPKKHAVRKKKSAARQLDIDVERDGGGPSGGAVGGTPQKQESKVAIGDLKMRTVNDKLVKSNKTIVIEGYADANRPDGERRASDRANIVKNQLIDKGVAPARIKVVTRVQPNANESVRVVAGADAPADGKPAGQGQRPTEIDAQPVGESNFFNPTPMSVAKGESAMVSMVRQDTEGEVVYLYDGESVRGNDHFAFRAVRFKNPTGSTLETGPVTVYGNERFIGEGLTEAIPPKSSAVVPFALDRQVVVERTDGEENRLSRLVTLQRGVLTAEVQHVKRQKLVLTNRMASDAKVFIRHSVTKGWKLVDSPPAFERIGDSYLFQVELKGHTVREITIAEATPMERTLDLNADVTLAMMKVYVDAPEATAELRGQLKKLLDIHKSLVDLADEQTSLRRRLADYKQRMDELHGQIVTLQAVRTGSDLMGHLKTKMKDISDRVQKTTIQIVDQEEKIMLARVQFQDSLAELSLNEQGAAKVPISKK